MPTVLLIRHGEAGTPGVLSGWLPDVHLSSRGRRQAEQLARNLDGLAIQAVYASPLERTIETARTIAELGNLRVTQCADLGELHWGTWEGRRWSELEASPRWAQFNQRRASMRPPGGEWLSDVQGRIVRFMNSLAEHSTGGVTVAVSHGDVIRCALAYYMGIPLDFVTRIQVAPASVSALELSSWGPRVLCMNGTGAELQDLLADGQELAPLPETIAQG